MKCVECSKRVEEDFSCGCGMCEDCCSLMTGDDDPRTPVYKEEDEEDDEMC